ncbi:MAG TPA: N-acetylmuramoyl-L-alanine amidase [Acidimicrobiia bacterium]|nr:N-acetylmuramoyl-L-alanine amidase [Acidimicrobiia bacterium]
MRRFSAVSVASLVLATVLAACSGNGGAEGREGASGSSSTTVPVASDTTVTTAPPPTEPPEQGLLEVGAEGATLHAEPGGAETGRIRSGVVLPYDAQRDGWGRVTTPCENRAWVELARGVARGPVRVVIDPGHGGDEPGAVGPSGLTEAEVNLDISQRAARLLHGRGVDAVLTRTGDYRATLAFRVKTAVDAGAEAFVSVHHNAEPDEERRTPGSESYFQFRSPESKRLTGLMQEEIFAAFASYDVVFGADFDAGAKWRLGDSGADYYGILRRSYEAGIPATLAESAFISNPAEEALLAREDVRQREAEAIARALVRYFNGEEPGDVFTEPYPRTAPAGGGGGQQGCVDPA